MKKLLTTLAALTVMTSSAFAQSFDPDNGTGNVLSFGNRPIAPREDTVTVRHSRMGAYAMVPRAGSAHVTRHKEGALSGNWRFAPVSCAVPEVNDAVGVWLPTQCEL